MVILTGDVAVDAAERRLLSAYRAASRTVKRRGREWYPTARAILEDVAADSGYTLEQVAAVFAILSPGAQLVTNFDWTRTAVESRGAVDVGRYPNQMMPKVRRALEDPAYAHEVVSGPKVAPFYAAILGDSSALVVDRWAAFAAGYGAPRKATNGDGMTAEDRRVIESAHRRAARKVRKSVRDFQATVWIHARETTPVTRHSKTYVPRLRDITA